MPELYDQVRQSNSKYIPQFVGSNFDTLKSLGDTLQERYKANKDLSDSLAIQMANDKYHQSDQYIGDEAYNKFNNLVDEIASSEQNFENSSGIVRQAVRDYGTDRNRIVALENNKKYQDYIAEKQKLGAKGTDFTPEFKGSFNPDGSVNHFQHDLQVTEEYDKEKERFYNDFEKNLIEGEYKGMTYEKGKEAFLRSVTNGGISTERILAYADSALNRYKRTAAYNQEARRLNELEGINNKSYEVKYKDNKGVTRTRVTNDVDEKIRESIINTGLEKVHNLKAIDLQRQFDSTSEKAGKTYTGKDGSVYEVSPNQEYKIKEFDRDKLHVNVPQNPTVNKEQYYVIAGESWPINDFSTNLYETQKAAGNNVQKIDGYRVAGEYMSKSELLDKQYQEETEKNKKETVQNYAKNYENLSLNEKNIFEKIVRNTEKKKYQDVDNKFLKTEEAANIVDNYYNTVDGKEVDENTPIIKAAPDKLTADGKLIKEGFDYTAIGASGKSLGQKATEDLRLSYNNRTFYNPETGRSLSGSVPNFLKEFNNEFDTDFNNLKEFKEALEVKGEYAVTNRFNYNAKGANKSRLADPLAANIGGKDIAVTREESYYDTAEAQINQEINKTYNAMKELPGIPGDVNLRGRDFLIGREEDENGNYTGRILLESKDRKFSRVFDNIEDIAILFTK